MQRPHNAARINATSPGVLKHHGGASPNAHNPGWILYGARQVFRSDEQGKEKGQGADNTEPLLKPDPATNSA